MRALIFNSGLGRRLGELTAGRPKCLVRLGNGETILHRQIRMLSACGVRDFVITTGPFAEMVEAEAEPFRATGCSFDFVANERYSETNYIYSMWLARGLLEEGDWLVLHGDLVFDAAYVQAVVDSDAPSLGSANAALPLPEKDFKARVIGGEVREVSVGIFDGDCVAFQPFYKLSEAAMGIWLDEVGRFVEAGDTSVYAEDAANSVLGRMRVSAFSYEGHFVEEVDTPEDLERVSSGIRLFDFEQQPVLEVRGGGFSLVEGSPVGDLRDAGDLGGVLSALGMRRPLVVTGPYFPSLNVSKLLDEARVPYSVFTGYSPNPKFEDVTRALDAYRDSGCDSLLSVGGGSAIDVAKCVKQRAAMPEGVGGAALRTGPLPWSGIPHVAVPTTAGTGSESTHFAVCYVGGEKVSVANDCLQPDAVILDPSNLAGLPGYQRKCALLDALCQAVESHWSRRSSEASRRYSSVAIPLIIRNAEAYLAGDPDAARAVMRAANLAGKAINLTTTTAPHAMSYKLTSMYGIPHGHAVALCMPHCWRALIDALAREDCWAAEDDAEAAWRRLEDVSRLMASGRANGAGDPEEGLTRFGEFVAALDLDDSWRSKIGTWDVCELAESVNGDRLSNFPLRLDSRACGIIYQAILGAPYAARRFS